MTAMQRNGLIGEEASMSLLEDALRGSPADATEVVLLGDSTEVTRYANSEIHQNVAQTDLKIAVRVSVGRATARVFSNSLTVPDIQATIRQAVELARLQAPNPHWTPLPTTETGYPRPTQSPQCWFEDTAAMLPASRTEAVARIVDAASREGFSAFGTYRSAAQELAVVSSTGVRSYAAYTTAYLKALVEGPGGTGFSDALNRDASKIDALHVAAQAVEKCRANRDQAEIAPGDYEAIFEPNAVADMLRFPAVWGMGARQTLDGQSFLSGKSGEQVASSVVSIWDDPTDPRSMPLPIDYEGMPATRVDIINRGFAEGPVYDAQTAQEVGMRSTGHASNPFTGWSGGPTADHVIMPVGDSRLEGMIKNVRRGVLVTRFHYTHCPDGKRVIATGTTRDGTFLIEEGEIVGALKNLRLEMGVLDLLSSIQEVGEGKSCQDWWAANGMATQQYFVPVLRFGRCTFTGVTTF